MRTMRRAASFAASWVLVGCAHLPPEARSGRDRGSDHARIVELPRHRPFASRQAGRVSTPRGDRTDWLYVRMPGLGGGPVELTLTWTPVDDAPSQLLAALYAADGAPLAELREGEPRTLTARFDAPAALPGFFVVLQAAGRDDAARYHLRIDHEPAQPGPPDVEIVGDLPAVPAGDDAATRYDQPEPCTPAWYRSGGTCNPPPPPLSPNRSRSVAILELSGEGDQVILSLDIGSEDGISARWRASIAGVDAPVTLTRVDGRLSHARTTATLEQLEAAQMRVQLDPR